jgi:hypothetical protein
MFIRPDYLTIQTTYKVARTYLSKVPTTQYLHRADQSKENHEKHNIPHNSGKRKQKRHHTIARLLSVSPKPNSYQHVNSQIPLTVEYRAVSEMRVNFI